MNLHLKLLLLTVLLAGRVQELEAASITQSGTVQLPTNHSVESVPNLGTDVTYQDTGSIALPLFDPALGPLTQVAVQLVSFAPNFTGTLTYGPLVSLLSVRCTQNHQISYGFSNGATGSSGPLGGVTDVLLNLSNLAGGTVTVTTDPAQIDSNLTFTDSSDLSRFLGSTGQVLLNASVNSHYQLTATVVPLALTGAGNCPLTGTITYTYTPATPTPTPTPSATPSPSETPTPTPSATPSPSETPTPTPSATPSPSETPTPTPSATPSPSETPTPTPSATPSPSETPTPTPSATPSPSVTPSPTPSPTSTPTATPKPTPRVTPSQSPTPSATPSPSPSPTPDPTAAELRNISTRFLVGTGDAVSIGGFIITGSMPTNVLIRAIGPSLVAAALPVADVLADPIVELHDLDGALLQANDNWRDSPDGAAIEASGIAPSDDRESAVLARLDPGLYTAVVRGRNETVGLGLVEIYNLDAIGNVDSSLANVSSRGSVQTGDTVLIGGFFVSGSSNILLRSLGPSLASFGVAGALADPTIEVYDSSGTLLVFNDNWQSDNAAEIHATGAAPSDSREAAAILILPEGAYTIVVRGAGNTTGIALVEAYFLGTE